MNKFQLFLLVFIITFILLFLAHYFIVTKPALKKLYVGEVKKGKAKDKKGKKKKDKIPEVGELNYLVYKFKLNKDKLNWKSLAIMISLINSFIMALVISILELIPVKTIFKLMIAFVLLFALIYALYEIYGRYLKRKQERERD